MWRVDETSWARFVARNEWIWPEIEIVDEYGWPRINLRVVRYVEASHITVWARRRGAFQDWEKENGKRQLI